MTARSPRRPALLALATSALLLSACSGGDSDKKAGSDEPVAPTPSSSTEPKPGEAGDTEISEPREFTHAYVYASALYAGLGQYLFDTGAYPDELTDETLVDANAPRATNMAIADYSAKGATFSVCVAAKDGTEFALLDTADAANVLVGKGDSCDPNEAVPYADSWLAQEEAADATEDDPSSGPSDKPTPKTEEGGSSQSVAPASPGQQAKAQDAAEKAVEQFLKTLEENGEFAETEEGGFGYLAPPESAEGLPLPDGVERIGYYEVIESPSGNRDRATFCLVMKTTAWGRFYDPELTKAQASQARPPITSGLGKCPSDRVK